MVRTSATTSLRDPAGRSSKGSLSIPEGYARAMRGGHGNAAPGTRTPPPPSRLVPLSAGRHRAERVRHLCVVPPPAEERSDLLFRGPELPCEVIPLAMGIPQEVVEDVVNRD